MKNGHSLVVLVTAVIAAVWMIQSGEVQAEYTDTYDAPPSGIVCNPESEPNINAIPGIPYKDYPVYHVPPETDFTCDDKYEPGMYADPEAGCQLYHVCNHGRDIKLLCPNGTIFDQKYFVCDWWYNVDCEKSQKLYYLNNDPSTSPYNQNSQACPEPESEPY